jgi:tRNA pseudouridine55 synthase
LDGILNINKPSGKTSFGVVALIKRLTGERHTGHAGTLDPDASGVLPICLGKATRVVEFLMDSKKTYLAEIELGKATDTFDGSGKVVKQGDTLDISINKVKQALKRFQGNIEQTPPMYSALKHQGQPLYQLARSGISVERKSRMVKIYRLDLLSWQMPIMALEVECSKGTYIRALANDLGEVLGCGAYLKNLKRTRYGVFDIDDAISLEQLEVAIKKGDWQKYLHPIDIVLQDMSALTVDENGESSIKTGSLLKNLTQNNVKGKYCRAYSQDGRFLAILTREKDSGIWRPKKVLI